MRRHSEGGFFISWFQRDQFGLPYSGEGFDPYTPDDSNNAIEEQVVEVTSSASELERIELVDTGESP
ncbi:hypothetical protein LIER_25763 [Lithospermum erythrorhizon]|uniref:Uncharacterized protein n=1 Tax=Lithospermum erythrorhizon TaxID=34254 RepID=A0AAV3R8Z9_LITER